MELTDPNPFDRRRLTDDVLHEWQHLVDLGAKLFRVKAGLITRLAGREIEILLSSETPGNPYRRLRVTVPGLRLVLRTDAQATEHAADS